MSKGKHTDLPWRSQTSCKLPTIVGADGKCVFTTGGSYKRPLKEIEANVALALLAANTHHKLVRALRWYAANGPHPSFHPETRAAAALLAKIDEAAS